MRRLSIAVAVFALAAACGPRVPLAPPVAVDPPIFRVDGVLPTAMDAYGVTLQVAGRIENPNPIALSVAHYDYAIELDGRLVASGRVTRDVALPARTSVAVAVPARLGWADVPGFVERLASRQPVPLHVRGVAALRGARAAPYEGDARVVLPLLPRLEILQTAVRDAGLLSSEVEVRIAIENPNDFPLPTGRLAYDLSLSGVSVVHAASHALAEVAPHGRAVVVVPIRFSTVGAAAGVLSTALGGRGELALVGRAAYGAFEIGVDARAPLVR